MSDQLAKDAGLYCANCGCLRDELDEDTVERAAIALSLVDDDERPLPSAWAGTMADYYRMLAKAALTEAWRTSRGERDTEGGG